MNEFEKEDYEKFIKEKCVLCGDNIFNKVSNYMLRGNYCTKCCARIERERVAKIKKRKL